MASCLLNMQSFGAERNHNVKLRVHHGVSGLTEKFLQAFGPFYFLRSRKPIWVASRYPLKIIESNSISTPQGPQTVPHKLSRLLQLPIPMRERMSTALIYLQRTLCTRLL
jgi:hypothetical protein